MVEGVKYRSSKRSKATAIPSYVKVEVFSRDRGRCVYCGSPYGYDARRGVQYQGGKDSPDVVGLPGVHIEVKRTERLDLYGALIQSKGDAGNDKPVVIHRKNNCEWVVIQPLEDWMELFRAWEVEKDESRFD